MDTILWILQIILAIKLLTVTLTHGLQQNKATIQEARQKMGAPARALLIIAAAGTLLTALGVILPRLLGEATWLTPLSAVLAGVLLLISVFLHMRSREQPKVFVSIVLFAFAAFIAYGRLVLTP
jgi:cbb3-type cytochrome oxidase subunit 1